jgi:hypothetical protein
VEIPGKVLAPGKYVFELLNGQSDSNLVEVFSEDSNGNESLVTTVSTIPDHVSDTPQKAIIRFDERPSGSPRRFTVGFTPGERTGWRFIYPKG